MSDFKELTQTSFEDTIPGTNDGIVIFYKELCPHCKNMEKVLAKFSQKRPEVLIMRINIEENASIAKSTGVERPPTLLIIKQGSIVSKKTGLMNPKELMATYDQA